jgi:hypothetical protein
MGVTVFLIRTTIDPAIPLNDIRTELQFTKIAGDLRPDA